MLPLGGCEAAHTPHCTHFYILHVDHVSTRVQLCADSIRRLRSPPTLHHAHAGTRPSTLTPQTTRPSASRRPSRAPWPPSLPPHGPSHPLCQTPGRPRTPRPWPASERHACRSSRRSSARCTCRLAAGAQERFRLHGQQQPSRGHPRPALALALTHPQPRHRQAPQPWFRKCCGRLRGRRVECQGNLHPW